jgi:hypothetical protein
LEIPAANRKIPERLEAPVVLPAAESLLDKDHTYELWLKTSATIPG